MIAKRIVWRAGALLSYALLLGVLPGGVRPALAGCNLIPAASDTFGGRLGAANRPFAAPGETVELTLRSCDASTGFLATGADHVVSVVIRPAAGGPGKLIALAANCATVDTAACPGAVCKTAAANDLAMITRDGVRHLAFRFPDTDGDLTSNGDDLTYSGPATIAVTPIAAPLPCLLTAAACPSSGLLACVDDLFFDEGSCGTAYLHPLFASFTALPVPNRYVDNCYLDVPPCGSVSPTSSLRVGVDKDGNLLVPMVWSGGTLLVQDPDGVPVPRLLKATLKSPIPIPVLSQAFLASLTPEGGVLPPIFEPQHIPGQPPGVISIQGSVDAPYTILRFKRHACTGAPNAGLPCRSSADCAPGTCDGLFNLAGLGAGGGAGPVVLPRLGPGICQKAPHTPCVDDGGCTGIGDPCVFYALEANEPVSLDGMARTPSTFGFVVSEGVAAKRLNADGDTADAVFTLRDRQTGVIQPIPVDADCSVVSSDPVVGRAVTRTRTPPFSFPTVEAEGNVVAFLEPEPLEGTCDTNGDGDAVDTILRAFRLGPVEVTAGLDLAADAALAVNGRSLAVSNGLVFVRTPERASSFSATTRASVDSAEMEANNASFLQLGTGRKLSADGRFVVFASLADDLAPGISPGTRCVFLRDLVNGTTQVVDVGTGGTPVCGGGNESISADGNFVSFLASVSGILPGTNGFAQVYVRDLVNDVTEFVSVDSDEVLDNGDSVDSYLSGDGAYVVFSSNGTNLAAPCTNGLRHIFLRDRLNGMTECLSVNGQGAQGDGNSDFPSISDDGTIVTFQSTANNLDPTDTNPSAVTGDIFVHDRTTGVTSIASRTGTGVQIGGFVEFPRLAGNGRFLAFETNNLTLCPLSRCVVVKDLLTGLIEPGSLNSEGGAAVGVSGVGALSADGRYLVFYSYADNLVPGDTNGTTFEDVFRRDRLTGLTERVSVGPAGAQGNARSYLPWVSDDGGVVVFQSYASNLVTDDTVAVCGVDADDNCDDVFVRQVGPSADCGNGVLEGGEECDPPAGACTAALCSPTCQCNDLTQDGDLDDTVLQVVNGSATPPVTPIRLCPADAVAVSGGTAAFLRPEAAGDADGCPDGPTTPADLNDDGDETDTVVHLSTLGGAAQNLDLGATAVALGATCSTGGAACSADADCGVGPTCRPPYLAALVSEAQEGTILNGLNGDADQGDSVVHIRPLTPLAPWRNLGRAADAVDMSGSLAAFLTLESAQGATPLNGDGVGDLTDRVLHLHDAAAGPAGTTTNTGLAAQEFVLGRPTLVNCHGGSVLRQLIAFRVREAEQGNQDLNQDGDMLDDVLHVVFYDVDAHTYDTVVHPTATPLAVAAVTPCRLEACDPQLPYRVVGDTVKFLTRESTEGAEGGRDLNGDGDKSDLVLQHFDACTGALTPVAAVDEGPGRAPDPTDDPEDGSGVVVTDAGRCFEGPTELFVPGSCTADTNCPPGATCQSGPVTLATPLVDADADGVPDDLDNCPLTGNPEVAFNPSQADADGDGVGDACDLQTSGCSALPRATGCRTPTQPLKASLVVKDNPPKPSKRSITWSWTKGQQTDLIDFGDPTITEHYNVCLYDETGPVPALLVAATAPAGGTCSNDLAPCWLLTTRQAVPTGYKYADRAGTPQGLTSVKLKAGAEGSARVSAKGKGTALAFPSLPLAVPVRVQLQASNGECWESTFSGAGVLETTNLEFRGKAD